MVFLPVITDIVFQQNRQVFVREIYSCEGLTHCRFRLGFYKMSSGFRYCSFWVSHLRYLRKVWFLENELFLRGNNKCRHSNSHESLSGSCFEWCLPTFSKLWGQFVLRIAKTSSNLSCIDIWWLCLEFILYLRVSLPPGWQQTHQVHLPANHHHFYKEEFCYNINSF